ncbi:Hypothetical protein D9617_2g054900 [Elsinoe fawcettii]|nr:Hypothetical protein D9617_2g054900 [Elsinoe fawcettii]
MQRNITLPLQDLTIFARRVPGLEVLLGEFDVNTSTSTLQYDDASISLLDDRALSIHAPDVCEYQLWLGSVAALDPSSAGSGSFYILILVSWVMLLLFVIAFTSSCLSPPVLRMLDEHIFHTTGKRGKSRLSRGLLGLVRTLGDIQVIVGLTLLLNTFLHLPTISNYHYSVSIYLAWLSLTSALLSLLLAQSPLRRSKVQLLPRLFAITTLLLLLIAHIPTTTTLYQTITTTYPSRPTSGIPIKCCWSALPSPPSPESAPHILALITLTTSFVWRIVSLFPSPRRSLLWVLKDGPHSFLLRILSRLAMPATSASLHTDSPRPRRDASSDRSLLTKTVRTLLSKSVCTVMVLHLSLECDLGTLRRHVEEDFKKDEPKWDLATILLVGLFLGAVVKGVEGCAALFPPSALEERKDGVGVEEGCDLETMCAGSRMRRGGGEEVVEIKSPGVEVHTGEEQRDSSECAIAVDERSLGASSGSSGVNKVSARSTSLSQVSQLEQGAEGHDEGATSPVVAFLYTTRFFRMLIYLLFGLLLAR